MKIIHLSVFFAICAFVSITAFPLQSSADDYEETIVFNNDVEEDFAPPSRQANVPKKPLTISSVKATTNQLHGPEAILTCPSKAPANCKGANFFKLDSNIASKCMNAGCTSPQIGTFKKPGLVSEESNDDLLQESDDDLEGDFSDENISEEENFVPPKQVTTSKKAVSTSTIKASTNIYRTKVAILTCPSNAPNNCKGANFYKLDNNTASNCINAGCTSPKLKNIKVQSLVSEESNDDFLQQSDDDLEEDFSDEIISEGEVEDFAPPSRQVGTRSPSKVTSYRTATSQKTVVWRYYCHFISKNAPSYCHGAKRKDIGKEKSALCEKAGCKYTQSHE